MPVIPATQEAEIRRVAVRSQPMQISSQDPILKIPITQKKKKKEKRAGRAVQGEEGPEFKT
jgi:hypothetical protein